MLDLLSIADLLPGVTRRRVGVPSGMEIALLDFGGDGPLALFHHANGFCGGTLGLVAQALRGRFRVMTMDARGHGDSTKPIGAGCYRWESFVDDLLGVADLLVAEEAARGRPARVALGLGHSFGGTTMLTAAARRPGLFERIVLVDPVIPPPPQLAGSAERRARLSRLASAARDRNPIWATREEAQQSWAQKKFFAAWRPEALQLYAAEGLHERPDGRVELKCPGAVEAAVFEEGESFDAVALARGLETPTLILWGAQGDFSRSVYEQLVESMGNARVEDIDAGHLAPMERPDLVVEATLRFVAKG